MKALSIIALGLAVVTAGCADRGLTTPGSRPSFQISDGAHAGNSDFFWLPPIASDPSSHPEFEAGEFNSKILPTVTVCRMAVDLTGCDLTTKTFGPGLITLSTVDEHYHVDWNTSDPALELDRIYRVTVTAGGVSLGFVDFDPVETGKELRNVETDQYVGLVDGRTLPIKFRIENGALCSRDPDCTSQSVTNDGGTVQHESGYGAAFFPAGWLPNDPATGAPYTNVIVTVEQIPVPPGETCEPGTATYIEFEACFNFRTYPDVGQFAKGVTIGMCIEIPSTDPYYEFLQILSTDDRDDPTQHPPTLLPSAAPVDDQGRSIINCEGYTGTAATSTTAGLLNRATSGMLALASRVGRWVQPKSLYAVDLGAGGTAEEFSTMRWVVAASASLNGGDGQSGTTGSTLPTPVSILVLSPPHVAGGSAEPIPGFSVTFAVTGGGGSVSQSTMTTDINGIASTSWTLGTVAGTNTLTASARALGSPVTFTATGVALPDLTISSGTPTATPSTVEPGGSVTLSAWTVTNQGGSLTSGISNGFYLSSDATITAADTYLDGNSNTAGVLEAGESFNWGGPTLTVPANTAPGLYYIGILVDRTNAVAESDETNNYVSTALCVGSTSAVITFEQYPDCSATSSGTAITDQWSTRGVTFSFLGIEINGSLNTTLTNLELTRSGNNPELSSSNADLKGPSSSDGGTYSGTMKMSFGGSPDTVYFEARVNNDRGPIPIVAYDLQGAQLPSSQIVRSSVTYTPCANCVTFRQETITVINPTAGISRVEVDANGWLVLLDDLRIVDM